MNDQVPETIPLTLKERIALLQSTTSGSNQSDSTSTSTSTTTTSSNNNVRGIALIGLAGTKQGSSSIAFKSSSSGQQESGETIKSNEIKSTIPSIPVADSTRPNLKSHSSSSNSSSTTTSIPLFSYPPLKPVTSQSSISTPPASSSFPSPSADLSTLPFKLPSNPKWISPNKLAQVKGGGGGGVGEVSIQQGSSNRSVPAKPKWLSQTTTTPVLIDPLTKSNVLPPKLPSRSNTLPSPISSLDDGPILPPRPFQASNSSSSSIGSNITPNRANRHRAPSADFESISLSKDSASVLAESLSPKMSTASQFSSNPTTSSAMATTAIIKPLSNIPPPILKPRPPKPPSPFATTKPSPSSLVTSFPPSSSTNNPTSVSSSHITPSNLSTFSIRAPLSPLAQRRPVESSSRIRFKLFFEKLMVENLNRMGMGSGDLSRGLDGWIVKWVWEKSQLKKEFLREVWNECDVNKKGSLTEDEFIRGLWIIDEELRKRSQSVGR